MARKPNLREILERSRVRRAGAIGLMEAHMLGSKLRANTQAQLLGKSLTIFQWLDPVERELLVLLDEPLEYSKLIELARRLNIDKEAVFMAVASLLQRGLVLLMDGTD